MPQGYENVYYYNQCSVFNLLNFHVSLMMGVLIQTVQGCFSGLSLSFNLKHSIQDLSRVVFQLSAIVGKSGINYLKKASWHHYLGRTYVLIHQFLCLDFSCCSRPHQIVEVFERNVFGLFFFPPTLFIYALFFGSFMTHAIILILSCVCVKT